MGRVGGISGGNLSPTTCPGRSTPLAVQIFISRIVLCGFCAAVLLIGAVQLGARPAHAQSGGPGAPVGPLEKVDLELVLMVDASGSIDDDEFILQRLGYARAFRNPRVISAIRNGPLRKIAIMYVEWTGPYLQVPIVDWTVLSGKRSAETFAARLEGSPRELFSGGTAVGHAILFGAQMLNGNRFKGTRRVIDISGDGPTNRGMPAALARDQVVHQGVTINGLPILNNYAGLDIFFLDNVIGGPGAFSIPAKTFRDFNSAVLTKLIREIAGRTDPRAKQAAEKAPNQ
jgi:hypothetical protein